MMKLRHSWLCFITIAIIYILINFSICFEERFRIFLRGKIPHNPNISTLLGTLWNQFSQNQSHNAPLNLSTSTPLSLEEEKKLVFCLIFTTVIKCCMEISIGVTCILLNPFSTTTPMLKSMCTVTPYQIPLSMP